MTQRAIDGPYIYFVTTNTTFGRKFFTSNQPAELLGRMIVNACRIKSFGLLGYAILPNHLHLLVRNENIGADGKRLYQYTLSDLMHSIKLNYSRQLYSGRFWKPRFNFRIIDDDQRFITTIAYMRNNFQKHGHPAEFSKTPFVYINWQLIDKVLGS